MELPFQQVFVPGDMLIIGMLIILEGVLSIDNALVLGLLAKRLPKREQSRALTYGLIGAFAFRFIAIGTAQYLLRWTIVKLLGGLYLLYVAGKYFFFESQDEHGEHMEVGPDGHPILIDDDTGKAVSEAEEESELQSRSPLCVIPERTESDNGNGNEGSESDRSLESNRTPDSAPTAGGKQTSKTKYAKFWPTVLVIELTDIAFAIDSILAAIALVGAAPKGHVGFHPKLWVVVSGGMLGVILMRFAAVVFIKLLERFPRFETAAYLLVAVIGFKLSADWGFNGGPHDLARLGVALKDSSRFGWLGGLLTRFGEFFQLNLEAHPHGLDFHSPRHWAFWAFWVVMAASLAIGFIPKKPPASGDGVHPNSKR